MNIITRLLLLLNQRSLWGKFCFDVFYFVGIKQHEINMSLTTLRRWIDIQNTQFHGGYIQMTIYVLEINKMTDTCINDSII